jgi:hypothetical protein
MVHTLNSMLGYSDAVKGGLAPQSAIVVELQALVLRVVSCTCVDSKTVTLAAASVGSIGHMLSSMCCWYYSWSHIHWLLSAVTSAVVAPTASCNLSLVQHSA